MAEGSVVDDAQEAELLRRLPGARVARVEGAGHSVQGDKPWSWPPSSPTSSPEPEVGPSLRPPFADARTAAAAGVTAAALVGLVASDLSTRRRPGDRVEDGRTGATVSVAIAVAVAVGAASLLRPGAAPLPRHPRTFGAGVALTWCGIALNRWGRRSLGPAYRPVVTVLADHEVVRRGPYRVVRHPMYAGTTLLCVGVGDGARHRAVPRGVDAPAPRPRPAHPGRGGGARRGPRRPLRRLRPEPATPRAGGVVTSGEVDGGFTSRKPPVT
jgi:protein-S-isoprenylcysteine O-methyltransferase Ste14